MTWKVSFLTTIEMIRIHRCDCPDCLVDAPEEGARYRAKDVVQALWEMQKGKCCYCECAIPEAGHGKAVEHFQPKSVFKGLKNEWTNLLLVCPQCNGKKSDKFPIMLTDDVDQINIVFQTKEADADPALIDPSDTDPEPHLTYLLDQDDALYGQIVPRGDSTLGQLSIEVTGIDDAYFLRKRIKKLTDILEQAWLGILREKQLHNAAVLEQRLSHFERHMQSDEEFAGLAREFARSKKMDTRFGLTIPAN